MITQIPCPPQVTLAVHENTQSFHIEGPLGSICMHLPTIDPMGFSFLKCTLTQIHLCPTSQTSRAHAQVSTLHSLILQGIEGVTKGWIVSLHLVGVGFRVEKKITVPSYRGDIRHQNDLSEELARVIGYDNIPVTSINLNKSINKIENIENYENKIKAFLTDNNFTEVINSPFSSFKNQDSIKVDNPLDSNRKYLRTNLTESLLENLIYNEKRQKDSIKFFEISDIYTLSNSFISEKRLAIIISGRRGHNYVDFSQKLDEKYLCNIFQEIGLNISKHILNIDRRKLNSKVKTPIFAIELKIDDLYPNLNGYIDLKEPSTDFIKYKPISEFPSSYRDLSFAVKDPTKINDVMDVLSNINIKIIKNSYMFDFYENKKINESKIGYRFIFQSHNRTLTDMEINYEISKIKDTVLSIESVSLPGS